MKNKFVAWMMVFCLIGVMMPVSSFAETEIQEAEEMSEPVVIKQVPGIDADDKMAVKSEKAVARINGVDYYSVQSAIDAASSGDKISVCVKSVKESVYIDKSITLDLNGALLWTDEDVDVIIVKNCSPKIMNGSVGNYSSEDGASAIAIYGASTDAQISNITATSVANDSRIILVSLKATAVIKNCHVKYDPAKASSSKSITACHVAKGARCSMINSSFEVKYGDAVHVEGKMTAKNCYVKTLQKDRSAVFADTTGIINIHSGYYYGHPALKISAEEDDRAVVTVYEGQFVSKYYDSPAIFLTRRCPEDRLVLPSGIIISNIDWKKDTYTDNVSIYKRVAAPEKVTADLTAAKGADKGYDDIQIKWSKSGAADGYLVEYKKGSDSYGYAKHYKKSSERSRLLTDLNDGSKFTVRVTPYLLINEDLLANGGTKCYSDKSKVKAVYTLKKVSLSKFTKSGKNVKISWKNINGETGYQISKATTRKGTKIVATYKTTSGKAKLIKAKKGKTYWYKVRAYKYLGKNSKGKAVYVYGPWSSAKSFKR